MGGHTYTHPALSGPPEAGGRLIGGAGAVAPAGRPKADLWPMFPHWEKLFSGKSSQKSEMSTLGAKTKVVRAEILHILVPIPSRGDLYLTISRVSIILSKLVKLVPSPRPYRSGLVVRPPAWDPKGGVRIHLLPI